MIISNCVPVSSQGVTNEPRWAIVSTKTSCQRLFARHTLGAGLGVSRERREAGQSDTIFMTPRCGFFMDAVHGNEVCHITSWKEIVCRCDWIWLWFDNSGMENAHPHVVDNDDISCLVLEGSAPLMFPFQVLPTFCPFFLGRTSECISFSYSSAWRFNSLYSSTLFPSRTCQDHPKMAFTGLPVWAPGF